MFQAIVHAPVMRPGARLCVSDLRQSQTDLPSTLAPGKPVTIRFGVCCADRRAGTIVASEIDCLTLEIADVSWRLHRCPARGGVDVPGLIAEDWFVVDRAPQP